MATRKDSQRMETHTRMLAAASACFRAGGYDGIGVNGVAEAAGVTSGAFYAHFGSKAGAYEEVLRQGLDEVLEALPRFRDEHGTRWVEAFVAYYLGEAHRRDRAGGCAMTALSPDLPRQKGKARTLYDTKMGEIAACFAAGLAGGSEEQRLERAWATLGTLIGALTLARALKTPNLVQSVLQAGRGAALHAAGKASR